MKVPKHKGYSGGGSAGDPVKGITRDKIPANASMSPGVQGYDATPLNIIDETGKVVGFYYMPTGGGTVATNVPTTPPASTSTIPAKPQLGTPPVAPKTKAEKDADFLKALQGWQNAKAQSVPSDIANHIQNEIKPNVQKNQALLDAYAAKKYGKDYNGTLQIGQQLSQAEGEKVLGKDNYASFVNDVHNYETYRAKTKGSYDTQNVSWGATDNPSVMYGTRMQNMFKNSAEQSAANTAKTPQSVLDWSKNPNLSKPQLTDFGGDHIKMIDGNNQTIPPIQYGPDGKPIIPKVTTTPTQFNKGGRVPKGMERKGYAEGSTVMPDLSKLSPGQLAQYNALTNPQDKQAMLAGLTDTATGTGAAGLSAMDKTTGSLAPMAGNAASSFVQNNVNVDPTNVRGNMLKDASSLALKRAGQGAAIGLNPLLMTATGGLSAVVAPAAFAVEGAIQGANQGKKKAKANQQSQLQDNIDSAQDATHSLAKGGPVEGAGTAKSDSIKAEIPEGSFIVPAENAPVAEKIRKMYLKDSSKAKLHDGGTAVKLSDGEHMFTPQEVKVLTGRGVNLDLLAPNQDDYYHGYRHGGNVSVDKAKEILRDGTAKGKALTDKQKGYFGWIAGGSKPYAQGLKTGGVVKDLSDNDLRKQREEAQKELNAIRDKHQSDLVHNPTELTDEEKAQEAELNKTITDIDSEIGNRITQARFNATHGIENTPAQSSVTPNSTQKDSSGTTSPVYTQVGNKLVDQNGNEKPVAKKTAISTGVSSNAVERDLTPAEKALRDTFVEMHSGQAPQAIPTRAITANIPDTTAPLSQIGSDADLSAMMSTGTTPASAPAPSAVSKVFDSLGDAAGLLALGQIGFGAFEGMKDKMPVDHVDPQLKQAQERAMQEATFGFTPGQYAYQTNAVERNRRDVVGNVSQFSGGNIGTAIGNTRMATIDANQANLGIASADAQLKQQKQGYADNLTSQVAQANRQIFTDSLNKYMLTQQAASNLMGAGLSNLSGAMELNKQQDRMDERAQKYPNDPWQSPSMQEWLKSHSNTPAGVAQ